MPGSTRKRGRPKLEINEKIVRRMALRGCSNCDIADRFLCDEGVIRRRFADLLRQTRAVRNEILASAQWSEAVKKRNVRMLIWLGKQFLGQKEPVSITTEHPIELTVTYE